MRDVVYRTVQRGQSRFIIKAFSEDHAAGRCVDEYPTLEEVFQGTQG